MLLAAQPHSLAQIWAHHRASAEWYEAGLIRWPRYGWGLLHVGLATVIYSAVWMLGTIPRVLALAALIALLWVLL